MISIERNTDVMIKCYKCGDSFTMDKMRVDPGSNNNLACRNCIERKQPSVFEKPSSAPFLRNVPSSSALTWQKGPASEGKVKYFCKDCKYRFSRAFHLSVRTCPYCGSAGIVEKAK